ncbi:hypothetical protein N9X61_02855 [Sulfurimonas sp.]|nr:hypothetical protein [Sulfurimonas sp.]
MKKRNLFIIMPFFIILIVTYIKYKEIPYEDYQNHSLKDMQKFNDKLEKISASFASKNNIQETYEKKLYNCVGEFIYTKNEDLTFKDVLTECKDDYLANKEITYYNQSWLMKDFNKYSGSYLPLQKIIQKTIKESKSFEMLKTTYEMKFSDSRPHMFVSIDFKGANIHGYILTRNMSAKVDAKTKEIYDLK